ncbi:MAG TPA: ATP-binding protein, partial [Burkholderiales bacterium]
PERSLTADGLAAVHRNALRLLKLVNTLLDFARIEAGRTHASYEPTDLGALTAELASNFRSACERAGLALEVDCPPLAEPAYVDREMWEKIVLNLLSNAFKFTLEGKIGVSLRSASDHFLLKVRDTGAGIPEEELPRAFERFHRIEGVHGRSHEGSGIGLALVQELVKLHGGSIEAESELGRGSTFTVRIPRCAAHLPADRIRAPRGTSTAVRAGAYVDEALSWLPGAEPTDEARTAGPRVLLADDNADLREYVRRLLAQDYEVEAVSDGIAALAAARANPPALVVSDVMMPGLDGFGLIQELRADPRLRTIPIVLLSARAGEEARMEGLGKGADDYLVKPFSGRELLVRVATLLRTAELRRQALSEQQRAAEELRRLVEQLSEADRRKDEFLATLSHELRNPLAPLRNSLELLRTREIADPASAPVHQMMDRQVGHLVRLVDDLLEVSRISRGTFELRRERIDLATVVRNAVDTSNPLIHAGGHELGVALPREPLWLDGDPVRLAQILANLLNNAATYTEHGGRIAVRAWKEDGHALIAVRDNGTGIAADTLPLVFQMFHRGAASSRRNPSGLGIGLSLARGLAEMHGGSITVKSDGPGQGSEFTVRLPLAADEPAPAADRGPEEVLPARRVLVVDDNRDAGDSLGLLLKVLGADVRVARDGPEALEACSAYEPAVVLLDIGMPGMDGYEVARRIRARSPGRRPTIVALTGWGQEKDRREAREAGFDHHLVKPAELGALKELLKSIPA